MEPDAGVQWPAGVGSPGRRCHRRPERTARVLNLELGASDGNHGKPVDHAGTEPEALVRQLSLDVMRGNQLSFCCCLYVA